MTMDRRDFLRMLGGFSAVGGGLAPLGLAGAGCFYDGYGDTPP